MSKKDRDSHIEPKRLKGFRDYPPELQATRQAIMDVIRKEAGLTGFREIATPALEYAETLVGQGGDETDKQVYRFTDHGGRDVALRFDLTVPFARFVAEHQNELSFPFKKLQIGDVWRGENTQKGRYREFCQCDLDIIGADSAAADAEILAAFQRILSAIDAGPFTQGVGDRVLLSALIRRQLRVSPDAETSALIVLDKLAKIGRDKVLAMLASLPGADMVGAEALLSTLCTKDAAGDTDLDGVAKILADEPAALAEILRLRQVLQTARAASRGSRGRLVLDLTLARGLAYYTGIVFETTLDGLPGFGSVSSGGRYNGLASRFTARELPGVGGSVGLDRLLAGMEELGKAGSHGGRLVFIAVATEDAVSYAFSLAGALRGGGVATDIGLGGKLGAQFKHADRLGCPLVLTVGTSEVQAATYALKTMASGAETRDLPAADVVLEVKRRLG